MGAVNATAVQRATWGELAAAGVVVTVDVGQLAVGVTGPRGPATVARWEIGWRRDAMTSAWRSGQRTTLLAVPGLRSVDRAFCLSCADRITGMAGDCQLCIAARVLALRDVGALTPRPPSPPALTVAAWRSELYAAVARPDPLPAPEPPAPWVCAKCGAAQVRVYADRDLECGRCELARITAPDLSGLR